MTAPTGAKRLSAFTQFTWFFKYWQFAMIPLVLYAVLTAVGLIKPDAPYAWAGPPLLITGLVVFGLAVIGGVAAWVSMKLEERARYTTMPGGRVALEQRHPVYDVVIRQAGAPLLGTEFAAVVKRVTDERERP